MTRIKLCFGIPFLGVHPAFERKFQEKRAVWTPVLMHQDAGLRYSCPHRSMDAIDR